MRGALFDVDDATADAWFAGYTEQLSLDTRVTSLNELDRVLT